MHTTIFTKTKFVYSTNLSGLIFFDRKNFIDNQKDKEKISDLVKTKEMKKFKLGTEVFIMHRI